MQNSKFKKALAEALISEYEMSIPQMEEHIFSKEFENKMKKLIGRRQKPYYKLINRTWKKAACAVIAVIMSAAIVMQAEAVRSLFKNFFVHIYDKFSMVKSIDNDNSPETIENIYAITYELNDYEIIYENYNDYIRNITYKNGDLVIDYFQYVKFAYDVHLNTENANIETLLINGKEMIYYKDNHEYDYLIWDNGDYIISISSNIGENSLIEIAESVQKVE